ncbi:hypothetical protein AHF37_09554 [Paragonimus kellicotti]|nr:hypothetical protein AHF37_09554 [Paragonimus kellicotti]
MFSASGKLLIENKLTTVHTQVDLNHAFLRVGAQILLDYTIIHKLCFKPNDLFTPAIALSDFEQYLCVPWANRHSGSPKKVTTRLQSCDWTA